MSPNLSNQTALTKVNKHILSIRLAFIDANEALKLLHATEGKRSELSRPLFSRAHYVKGHTLAKLGFHKQALVNFALCLKFEEIKDIRDECENMLRSLKGKVSIRIALSQLRVRTPGSSRPKFAASFF